MSGIDEQCRDVNRCPSCKEYVLAWSIFIRRALDLDLKYSGFYNCTDTYDGPDYRYNGSVDAIYAFKCLKCGKYVEKGENFFRILLENMLESRRLWP